MAAPLALFVPFRRGRSRSAPGSTTPPVPAAPSAPNTPTPAIGGTKVYGALRWLAAGATKFDVYLDTNPAPTTLVSTHGIDLFYTPTVLPATTYYWKVVAFNDGGSTTGPVWSFTTPAATAALATINGAIATPQLRSETLTVQDQLGATPREASGLFTTTAPVCGQICKIGIGSLDPADLIFAGEFQTVEQLHEELQTNLAWQAELVDYTFLLNRRRPFGSWTNVSLTTIGRYAVSVFAPGFTSTGIQDGLPAISIVADGSEDFSTFMSRAADLAGVHYAGPDYAKSIRLFATDTTDGPAAINNANPPLDEPTPLTFIVDTKQVRSRAFVKGAGVTLAANVGSSETILPLSAQVFDAGGGHAIIGVTPFSFSSASAGGALTAAAAVLQSPSAPSSSSVSGAGGGIAGGVYYAQTFVGPLGESELSPASTVFSGGPMGGPQSTSPSLVGGTGGNLTALTQYYYAFRSVDAVGGTSNISTSSGWVTTTGAGQNKVTISTLDTISDARAVARIILRSAPGASYNANGPWYEVGQNAPSATSFVDTAADLTGATSGGGAGTGGRSATVTLATGPAGTTARKGYRTVSGGSPAGPFFLVGTISDNVTASFVDAAADSALTTAAPAGSSVSTAAGSSTLGVTDLAKIGADSGWVLAGSQLVRFTGRSAASGAGTLTGIPTSGTGAIVAPITAGAVITTVPSLLGVNSNNGLFAAQASGASINLWAQRDDPAAQTALGLLELDDNGLPTDGIHEYYISDDTLTTAAMCNARGDADLLLYSRPIVTAKYCTRDRKTVSGKTVVIDLTTGIYDPAIYDPLTYDTVRMWGISNSFVIQDVTITEVDIAPNTYPLRTVVASSLRFTLDDIVRRWQLAA